MKLAKILVLRFSYRALPVRLEELIFNHFCHSAKIRWSWSLEGINSRLEGRQSKGNVWRRSFLWSVKETGRLVELVAKVNLTV